MATLDADRLLVVVEPREREAPSQADAAAEEHGATEIPLAGVLVQRWLARGSVERFLGGALCGTSARRKTDDDGDDDRLWERRRRCERMDSVPERDGAAREVAQVYEFIKSQQPLLLQYCNEQTQSKTSELALSLISEALRGLHVALSVINHQPSAAAAVQQVSLSRVHEPECLSVIPGTGDSKKASCTLGRGKRRRLNEADSWIISTTMPFDDGYEWRKYGEKKINGCNFTRNYFRCSYKYDRGCQARKQIQQKDNKEPPTFEVIYNNKHTCRCTPIANKCNMDNDIPLQSRCNTADVIRQNGNATHKKETEQSPVTVDVGSFLLNQTVYPEAFPVSSNYGVTIAPCYALDPPSTSIANALPNTAVMSCDEYLNLGQHESLEDNALFYDPGIDLLLDSFNYH
ncbi:EcWRKY-6, partial [Eragrostis curvula]